MLAVETKLHARAQELEARKGKPKPVPTKPDALLFNQQTGRLVSGHEIMARFGAVVPEWRDGGAPKTPQPADRSPRSRRLSSIKSAAAIKASAEDQQEGDASALEAAAALNEENKAATLIQSRSRGRRARTERDLRGAHKRRLSLDDKPPPLRPSSADGARMQPRPPGAGQREVNALAMSLDVPAEVRARASRFGARHDGLADIAALKLTQLSAAQNSKGAGQMSFRMAIKQLAMNRLAVPDLVPPPSAASPLTTPLKKPITKPAR